MSLGRGLPLPAAERRFFEPRFGRDLSLVRLHTGERAGSAAAALGARAFAIGGDIVFARGQYAPGTTGGRRLLAHELTHTLQQARGGVAGQDGEAAVRLRRRPAVQRAFSVTYNGCDQAPFDEATVSLAARQAYDEVDTTDCVSDAGFRKSILGEFDGMTLDCEQRADGLCGRARRHLSHTINIFPTALTPGCGPLASTILHEAIHLTESAIRGHGDLAAACEKSCFGFGDGDAADCTAPAPPLAEVGLEPNLASFGLPGVGFDAEALAGLPLEPSGTLSAFTGVYSTLVLGLDPAQRNAFMLGGLLGISARLSGSLNLSAQARAGAGSLDLGGAGGLDPTALGRLGVDYRAGSLTASGEASAGALFTDDDSPQAYFGIGVRLGLEF